jgi:hypothetical protein
MGLPIDARSEQSNRVTALIYRNGHGPQLLPRDFISVHHRGRQILLMRSCSTRPGIIPVHNGVLASSLWDFSTPRFDIAHFATEDVDATYAAKSIRKTQAAAMATPSGRRPRRLG